MPRIPVPVIRFSDLKLRYPTEATTEEPTAVIEEIYQQIPQPPEPEEDLYEVLRLPQVEVNEDYVSQLDFQASFFQGTDISDPATTTTEETQ